jgi:hypothetical protein
MKKTINGIRYNTKNCTLIFIVDTIYPKNDIRWSEEYLYKTKSGKYFLLGIGGPGSPYARTDEILGNKDGEHIIPMPYDKLIVWAEEYMPDEMLKVLLKDIKQELKRNGIEIPEILNRAFHRLAIMKKVQKLAEAEKAKSSQPTNRTTYVDW